MGTVAELAGAQAPLECDTVSFAPSLLGQPAKQHSHAYLYWEFYERGSKQAVRAGDWKAIRMPMFTGKTELYNLALDLGEANNLAAQHPEIVSQMEAMMKDAHAPSPNWKPRGTVSPKQPEPGDGKPRF